MASFTNNRDEKVFVSDEFVDRAVEIYEELKKVSPSGRVSWAKLKKLMRKEGHDKAESNESFRQLIKRERAKRGQLPSVEKHADLVAESKLDALEEEIGEWRVSKREAQDQYIKLNRLKRELIRENQVLKIMKEKLDDVDFSNIEFTPFTVGELEEKKMVACLSDIHFGAKVDLPGHYYDRSVAYDLIMEYADKIIEIAEESNVAHIHVVNLGDTVEGAYLRHSNAFEAESHWSEQVIDASKIIVEFLTKLSKYTKISYSAIEGNHDRISQADKGSNLYGDGAIHISNAFIEVATQSNDQIEFVETPPYHHLKEVNGFNFLFVHGDRTKMKSQDILGNLSTLHGVNLDAVIGGHIHHFTMREVGINKYVTTFGSVKGFDNFSSMIGSAASRSQGVIIVGENDYEIRKVNI